MKKITYLLLLLAFPFYIFAQQSSISNINIGLSQNPDANTANWGSGTNTFTISAVAKMVSGRIDPIAEGSKILVTIKKSGSVVCGIYKNSTAPSANFSSVSKVWNGNAATSLLGQDCVLPTGEYELNVQFFGNGPTGLIAISDNKTKAFTIRGMEQQTYQAPQALMPSNGTVFKESDIVKPISFRWTPIVPKPQQPPTYRLKVWQLMQGQNGAQAMKANQPIFEKDVENLTQATINNLITGPCKPPYLCEFVWNVQALNREGKAIGENNGTSENFSFSYTNQSVKETPIKLVSPANKSVIENIQSIKFSWKAPQGANQAVSYKIQVIEVNGDQSPEAAFGTNKPIFEKDSPFVRTNKPHFERDSSLELVVYNSTRNPVFKEGKSYAWRVQAKDKEGRGVGGNDGWSENFSFKMGTETAVKIDSIKLICTSTYGIYNYQVYVKNPLTTIVVLNGFWCRKPADNNLIQLYANTLQTPANNTQISANSQIIISGQVNLLSQAAYSFVRFTAKTSKLNNPVDNATVTDSIRLPDCSCNPCKEKSTSFGTAASAMQTTYQNNGSVNVNSSVTHTPKQVIKVSAQIVNVERLGESGCLLCTKESKEFGNFTGGSLNNNAGNIVNGAKGYGKQIQWQYNSPTLVNNYNYNLQMMFPPLTQVSCCKDSIKICTRWSFTDKDCVTCDTLICSVIKREYKVSSGPRGGPISTDNAVYASQIKAMGSPYTDWYDQATDELPKDFRKKVEELWQKEQITKETEISREKFEENITMIFSTIRGLKTRGSDADPVLDIIKNSTRDNSPNTQCGNGDFETGQLDMNEWGGGFGTIHTNNNPSLGGGNYTSGFSPSPVGVNLSNSTFSNNHSIVSQASFPSWLSPLPSNQYAFRLGNSAVDYGSEILSKRFTVDANGTGIIKFMYALILQDPGSTHQASAKPSFWVKVYDDSWNLITGKVYLDPLSSSPVESMVANVSNPFFQVNGYGTVVYRDWTCAKIDLSDYKGRELTVAFVTTDCIQSLHYGQAYIDNWCGNCDGATTGSVNIKPIADSCIKQGTQICIDYSLPKIGTTTGSGTINIQFYQNGNATPYSMTSPTLTANGTYCFNINPANLPCTNGQQGYDIVATGNFTINSTNIVVNSPDPVGTSPNIQGIKPGLNNDLVCCTILTPADICCTNFVKQVAATVSMEGNTTSGYNVIKFVPTFVVGPKRTKQVRISVVNFETSSKNKECLSCEKNISNYGTMRVPQNIMGGGKDDIEGMVYPTYPNIVTCVGCPPNWSNRLSSEVTWGSQSGPGFDLTAGSGGDQSTIFRITLPKQSTLSCCDDTIKVCIKYSFTDVDCKTCDTIICYKIVNRATITTTANTSIIGLFGDKPINKIAQTSNIDRLYNRSDLRIDPIAKNTSVFSKTHSNINSLYIDVPLVGLEFLNPKKYYAR